MNGVDAESRPFANTADASPGYTDSLFDVWVTSYSGRGVVSGTVLAAAIVSPRK
jgi:hypothetical protein